MRKKLVLVLAAAALMMQAGCGNQTENQTALTVSAPTAEADSASASDAVVPVGTQEPETEELDWDEILATLSEAVAKVEAAAEQSTAETEEVAAATQPAEETEPAPFVPVESEETTESTVVLSSPISGTTVSYLADSAELTAPVLLEPSVTIPEGYTTVTWYLDSAHMVPVTFPYAIPDSARESGISLFPVYGN